MSQQASISKNSSQIKQLFSVRQKNVAIQQINKFLQSHNQTQLLNFDFVKQISFSTYQVWQKANQSDVNRLLQIQIYEQFQSQLLKKPEQVDNILKVANEHLARISKQKIIEEIMKQICELPHQGHIYIAYNKMKKEKEQEQREREKEKEKQKTQIRQQSKILREQSKKSIEKSSSQKVNSPKEQRVQKASQNEENKAVLIKPEIQQEKQKRKHQQQIKIQQIMNNFYAKEEISVEEMKLLQQKTTLQCNVQLLKQYKKSLSKSIDSKQVRMSLLGYEIWNKSRIGYKQPQKMQYKKQKEEKQDIKVQSQNKSSITKVVKQKKSEGKVLNMLEKYLKDSKNGDKDKQRNEKLRLQIDYLNETQLVNPLEFQIKAMFGDKYINKYLTEMIGKKLMKSQQQPYLVIELETQKGEIIQQRIQQIMKDSNHNLQNLELVTVSQKTKLFISIPYKNDQQFRKIHDLVEQSCKGSVEMKGKFALGNQEKVRPSDMKLIKCIAKGFNFLLESQGNNQFNHRFRKNLQLQNRESTFFQLLCLTKNSEIKLKLKKLQDLNSFFAKLGIVDAIKTTPSIKEIVHELVLQIFQFHETLSIDWLICQVISGAESAKIRLTKANKNTLITASLQPDILHEFFPK